MYFGAHVKSSGGVWHAIENGVALGAEAVQFFAGSPRTWAPTVYKEKDAAQFARPAPRHPSASSLIHTIYLINLASEKEDFYEKSVTSLCGALAAAEQLGADAIVTHIGSHQGAGFAAGLERVQAGLRRALAEPRARRCASCSRTRPAPAAPWASTSSARPDHRRRRRRPAPRRVPRHGAPLRVRRRPAHARGHGRGARARRRRLRPRAPRRAAPQRLQDAARVQPRPSRERGRGRPRHGRLPHASSTSRRSPTCPGILEVPGFDGQGPDKENLARLRDAGGRQRLTAEGAVRRGILGWRRTLGAVPGLTPRRVMRAPSWRTADVEDQDPTTAR